MGSARASRAVFRAPAENTGRAKRVTTSNSITRHSLVARRGHPHPGRVCSPILSRFLTACLALAATISFAAAPLKIGDAFPDFAKFKLEGKLPVDLKGKVVLVDFWTSWCPPCKKSFPALNELHHRYGSKGFVIIAVNVDEKRADMEAFLKKIPATFTVVRDAEQKLVETAGVEGLPTSYLLDATGRVRFLHNKGYGGDETKKKYAREIEELLNLNDAVRIQRKGAKAQRRKARTTTSEPERAIVDSYPMVPATTPDKCLQSPCVLASLRLCVNRLLHRPV